MKKVATLTVASALPIIAFAQTVDTIFSKIITLINYLTIIVVALSVLAFFWGLFKFITRAGEDKEEGRHIMIWGILALFVMLSVWGLVGVVGNTFGIQQGGAVNIPGVGGSYGGVNTGTVNSGASGGINVSGGINIPIR